MSAVVAQRVDPTDIPDTSEIQDLARAAGYQAVDVLGRAAEFDPYYGVATQMVPELADRVAATEATAVIVDDKLTPHQTYNLATRLPTGTEVVGRHRLVLDILAARADTREAQLQVERAECEYERRRLAARGDLARRDEHPPACMGLDTYDPAREDELEDRISRLRTDLNAIVQEQRRRIKQRRDAGFDLVALAGYTNAGKSTLMQRLATDLTVGQDAEQHVDIEPTVEVADEPFTTLTTTTRKVALPDRDILLTDTMGLVCDLPEWLLDAFRPMIDPLARADLVVLVVDATDPLSDIREKIKPCQRLLTDRDVESTILALTKIDQVANDIVAETRAALEAEFGTAPVAVSALDGTNIAGLKRRLQAALPDRERSQLELPLTDEAMSLVSRIHDDAHVHDMTYGVETVRVDFEARPQTVAELQSQADSLDERD